MARSTTEFTAAMIFGRIADETPKSGKLTESKKLKEAFDPEVDTEEELDNPEEGAEETLDDEPVPPVDGESEETDPTLENGEDFEESDTNDVYFCSKCKKHFLATEDTPEGEIECPVCGEKDILISLGSAADALDREENQDVAVELKDEEPPADEEIPDEEELPAEEEMPEEEFDEDGLEEALNILAQKYLNERARVRVKGAKVVEGNLVLEGRIIPLKKGFTVVLEGFDKNRGSSKFIVEGTTDIFKSAKLKFAVIKEGNVFKVKKMGYGILTESMKNPVSGIIG